MNLHPNCFCKADWFVGQGKTCDYCKQVQFQEAVKPLNMSRPADVLRYRTAKKKYLGIK